MKFLPIIALSLIWLAQAPSPAGAENSGPSGKNWRVFYVEGGPLVEYCQTFQGLLQGLYQSGLLSELPPPGKGDDLLPTWQWLAEKSAGRGLEFSGFYSADWDPHRLAEYREEIVARARRGEVDLILAFGTAAGKAMITDDIEVPVMSLATTDPVNAGLSLSEDDSGRDNVHVQVIPGNVEYQLALFHNLFGFKTLGLPHDSDPEVSRAAGVPALKKAAAERGITIIPCAAELEIEDQEKSFQNMQDCLEFLAPRSEAVLLNLPSAFTTEPGLWGSLLAPIIAHQRPSFSLDGLDETRLGILMSMSNNELIQSGLRGAEVLREILNGAKPRSVDQAFLPPMTLALNLKMARLIGWRPPFEVLAAIHVFFDQVAGQDYD